MLVTQRIGLFCLFFIFSQSTLASLSTKRFLFKYKVNIPLLKSGAKLQLWVPYPNENEFQYVENQKIYSSLPWKLTQEKKYGNRMIYLEGKPNSKEFEAVFLYVISRSTVGPKKSEVGFNRPELFLKEDKKIPFLPVFQEIAAKQLTPGLTKEKKIRKLYDYIVRTMSYDKSGQGWGNGDAVWACSTKRGNCTDFHSLLIGLLRVSGIPARFVIGFPITKDNEAEISGYHCWAEAHSSKKGWIPMDASEAKKSGSLNAYFGQLPADRVEFTLGRDLVLEPPQTGEPLNYFIYPHVEVEGLIHSEIKKQFSFRRLKGTDNINAMLSSAAI